MRYLSLIFLVFLLAACAVRPAGVVLTRNVIKPDRAAPAASRVTAEQIAPFMRLTPRPPLRFAVAPTMLDSTLIERSVRNITAYLRARGYYDSRVDWGVEVRRRHAKATYRIWQGEPYRIGRLNYRLLDSLPVDTLGCSIKEGSVFDVEALDAERLRLANDLRNKGYYKFGVDNIEYVADTARLGHTVDLTMVVRPEVTGYDQRGEPQWTPHQRFTVAEIDINPAPREMKVRARTLRRAVDFHAGELYDASRVSSTYSNIMRMGYFRSAAITFSELAGDSLKAVIAASPALRHSVRTDVEGSMSSNFYALGATLGYQNRNIFRGAELFEATLTGRYEFMRLTGGNTTQRRSFEVGGGVSLSWPRLLVPLRWRPQDPRTRLEATINYQQRPIYRRMLSGVRFGYTWRNARGNASWSYRPVDLNVIDVRNINEEFLAKLRNPWLRGSYMSQLVPATSLWWVRSGTGGRLGRGTVRVGAETAGNIFSAFSRLVDQRFPRYVRLEGSFAHTVPLGLKSSFVWRAAAGWAANFGNQRNPIPIDRLFYSGGSNSMRGWVVRRLGPGKLLASDKDYPSQVANMKLEMNAELRFPVWDFVHGAVFADAGNIWFAGRRDYEEGSMNDDAMFRWGTFARQMGLDTGLGVRLDFNRFLFRVDWGIKLHDPGQPFGQRWIRGLRLRNTALNFGVGYPF